ncbi:hypothetical protein EON65_53895, partial [archaeon]
MAESCLNPPLSFFLLFFFRDVDYNPNKPHTLVSCGEDRYIKFWDLRKLSTPTHTHSSASRPT